MQSLPALTVIALTACAIAHPPVVREGPDDFLLNGPQTLVPPNRKSIRDYLLPRYIRKIDDSAQNQSPHPQMPASDWLNEEIDRINRMQVVPPPLGEYQSKLPHWVINEPYKRVIGPTGPYGTRIHVSQYFEYPQLLKSLLGSTVPRKHPKVLHQPINAMVKEDEDIDSQAGRKMFAFTPLDEGYFELNDKNNSAHYATAKMAKGLHEGGGYEDVELLGPRRQIRQNPISRTKDELDEQKAEQVDKHRAGVYNNGNLKSMPDFTSTFGNGNIYTATIGAIAGTFALLALVIFAIGWYTLSKCAKAAADVDYPAYGVTGPNTDASGDRKLAHSAQMYHYQHQKQQIIAMERNNVDQRNGSISDPESEEENEEGDYTVYECPGFATTGEIEVKNPLFNEEATPATPGKVELVKPQAKE